MLDSPTHPDRCCLPAAALALALCATSAFAVSADAEAITAPARQTTASPGVLASSPARQANTIASLALSSDNPDVPVISDAGEEADGATNFRGEKVVAAPVRYVEDFESGQVGPEWGAFGGTLAEESLTTFADPAAGGGLVLNVKTESDSAYEIRLDVYLVSSSNAESEQADTSLSVFVDDEAVMQLSPKSLRELSGKEPEPGRPLTRTIRVPFTAAHPIAELRFEAAGKGAGVSWGIDNLVIDLGLQDPVFGITGGGGGYDPGSIGLLDPGAGLTGELPPLPKSRYGSNEPFAGDGPGGAGGSNNPPIDPTDQDRDDDGIDDEIEDETDEVPSPPTLILLAAALTSACRRSTRARPIQ
jgi:hypothetical protein